LQKARLFSKRREPFSQDGVDIGRKGQRKVMRILIAEDEARSRVELAVSFENAGFNVIEAEDGQEGLFSASEDPLDVALINLTLPVIPGLEVVRRLRAVGKRLPVLALSARNHWQAMVEALNSGVDDVIAKPCEFPEVLARVHVLLRRSYGWSAPDLICPPVRLQMRTRQVTVHGCRVELSNFEYRVLEHLMLRAGEVVSKTELSQRLYGEEHEPEYNAIDTLIARVRRKIDPEGTLVPIITLRGSGYRFALARR
jgi:two-component system response regulator PhoP